MPTRTQLVPAKTTDRDYQLAAVVASHIAIDSISLISISAALRTSPKDLSKLVDKGGVQISVNWKTEHALTESGLGLSVKIDFQFQFSKEQGKENDLQLECGYILEYSLDAPPPPETRDELIAAFAKVNAVYNAWPYLREIVQNTFARMNLPPPVLPVFRAVRPSQQKVTADDSKPPQQLEAKSG